MDTSSSFPVKRPIRKADHLSAFSVEAKNEWSYISTPPYAFLACAGTNLPLRLPELLISLLVLHTPGWPWQSARHSYGIWMLMCVLCRAVMVQTLWQVCGCAELWWYGRYDRCAAVQSCDGTDVMTGVRLCSAVMVQTLWQVCGCAELLMVRTLWQVCGCAELWWYGRYDSCVAVHSCDGTDVMTGVRLCRAVMVQTLWQVCGCAVLWWYRRYDRCAAVQSCDGTDIMTGVWLCTAVMVQTLWQVCGHPPTMSYLTKNHRNPNMTKEPKTQQQSNSCCSNSINNNNNNNNNTWATYLESASRNYRQQPYWHCTRTAESTDVKVQNMQHGKYHYM
jgi:hypothetical protein